MTRIFTMKKIIFFFLFLFPGSFIYSQTDLLAASNNKEALKKTLDSALIAHYYISNGDAAKILNQPVYLKDSTYKYSGGILRFTFDYLAKKVDSTSKGRVFFSFEQYKDPEIAKVTYQSIKTENEKSSNTSTLKNLGEDAFLQKDNLNQPFIMILDHTKIYKIRVFSVTSQQSQDELMNVAKKLVASH
ncbi:MAG: hypothetical protein JWP12_699 [Bacteroidetes bacterium]|nr:hypothetical protein [Bacteroidota bacterium]